MRDKLIVRSEPATRDVEAAAEHYWSESSASNTQRFLDAVEEAYLHISRLPASGSQHYGGVLRVPGLRSWPLNGFPYRAFYIERDRHIDIVRVLHTSRDLPASLRDDMED